MSVLVDLLENVAAELGAAATTAAAGAVFIWWRRRRRGAAADHNARPTSSTTQPRTPVDATLVVTPLDDLTGFVGRSAEVDVLAGRRQGQRRINALLAHCSVVVLHGMRGVGTSWCAQKAAYELQAANNYRFARVDVRATPLGPLGPLQVLRAMAVEVGLPVPEAAPTSDELGELARLLRRHLGRQRVVFLLDNVDHPSQVAPIVERTNFRLLIAGGPACRALPRAETRQLLPLPEADAVDLFTRAHSRMHNEDLRSHQNGATRIVRRLGGHPHLLFELGSWGIARRISAASLAKALCAALDTAPFGSVRVPEVALEACHQDTAYAGLSPAAQRRVRLLSMVSHHLSRRAVVALTGDRSAGQPDAVWQELADAGFVAQGSTDDRRLVPEIRALARLHLVSEEPIRQRRQAYARLVAHLAKQASAAASAVTTEPLEESWCARHAALLHEVVILASPPTGRPVPPPRATRRRWFELAESLCAWYEAEGDTRRARSLAISVRRVARRSGEADVEGWAECELGNVALRRGQLRTALGSFERGLDMRAPRSRPRIRLNIGAVHLQLGDTEAAVDALVAARDGLHSSDTLARGSVRGLLGDALLHRARSHAPTPDGDALRAQDLARAHRNLVEAADILEGPNPAGYAAALQTHVLVFGEQGNLLGARRAAKAAIEAYSQLGDHDGAAEVRLNLAAALLRAAATAKADDDDLAEADDLLSANAERLQDHEESPLKARTQVGLGDLASYRAEDARRAGETGVGQGAIARLHWARARDIAAGVGDEDTVAEADRRLGRPWP